jgi:hypothetical protein
MTPDLEELRECCSRLGAAGYTVVRVDEFDGAAIAFEYGDDAPVDVGLIMTHDALDFVRRTERVALLRELAAELRTGTGDLSDAIGDSGSFFGPKRYPEEILDERADALEKGTP